MRHFVIFARFLFQNGRLKKYVFGYISKGVKVRVVVFFAPSLVFVVGQVKQQILLDKNPIGIKAPRPSDFKSNMLTTELRETHTQCYTS